MALWTILPSISITKEQVVEEALPAAADAWGARSFDELEQPKETVRFTAEGLTRTEVLAIRTIARTRNATYSFTDMAGDDYEGFISSFEATQIAGTDRWNASLALLVEDIS